MTSNQIETEVLAETPINSEETQNQTKNWTASTTFEQPQTQNDGKKKKQRKNTILTVKAPKFKGWKKAIVRLVLPVRAFASGSKKGSTADARDLSTSTPTDRKPTTQSPTGATGWDWADGRATTSSGPAAAATAATKKLFSLAAPKLPLVSALASPVFPTESKAEAEAPSLSLSLPTPTIPTITITPTTPTLSFGPPGLGLPKVRSRSKAGSKEEKEEHEQNTDTEGETDALASAFSIDFDTTTAPASAPHVDYFSFNASSGPAVTTTRSKMDGPSILASDSSVDTKPTLPLLVIPGEGQVDTPSSSRGPQLPPPSSSINPDPSNTTYPETDASVADAATNRNAEEPVDDVETGDKKKNKKKKKKTKKGTSLSPTNLISPKALDVVKKGMNTASSASANVGSLVNSGNNAVSTLMSSSAVSSLASASKLTDSLPLKRKEFDVMIPVGPVAFVLKGYIERANLEIDASFNVKVGFVTHKLGKVQGNLMTGVRIKFGLSGVLTGQARFYMPLKGERGEKKAKGKGKGKGKVDGGAVNEKEIEEEGSAGGERSKWLWLDIKVTVFREDIGPLSLPLVPLRFGDHKKTNSEARSVRSISISVIEDVEDGSGQLTTFRRSIDVDVVGGRRSISSIRKSYEHPNHRNQLESYSFCSSSNVLGRSLEVYPEPGEGDEEEGYDGVEEGGRGYAGFMVGYHS